MLNQFSNLSCYEEFEIQCTLIGISKLDVLKEIGHQVNDYYFFVSNDGIFNWFDLDGNHIGDPGVLETLVHDYIPYNITKCIIPNSVTSIGDGAFWGCESLKEITIPNSVTSIGYWAFCYCTSLTSISIPNSITCIGYKPFYKCNFLKEIIFKGKTLEEVKKWKNILLELKMKMYLNLVNFFKKCDII